MFLPKKSWIGKEAARWDMSVLQQYCNLKLLCTALIGHWAIIFPIKRALLCMAWHSSVLIMWSCYASAKISVIPPSHCTTQKGAMWWKSSLPSNAWVNLVRFPFSVFLSLAVHPLPSRTQKSWHLWDVKRNLQTLDEEWECAENRVPSCRVLDKKRALCVALRYIYSVSTRKGKSFWEHVT